MKKTLSLLAVGLLGGMLLCQQANAASITGGISLAGGPIGTDTGNLATATKITSFGTVTTSGTGTGTYSAVGGGVSVPTTTGFTFNPILVPSPTLNVWSVTQAGITYSFDLYTIATLSQGVAGNGTQFLNITGTGILHVTGFTDTVGSYILTANSAGGTFSFSSSNGAQVPDGGFTLALLGLALTAVEGLRRTLRK